MLDEAMALAVTLQEIGLDHIGDVLEAIEKAFDEHDKKARAFLRLGAQIDK